METQTNPTPGGWQDHSAVALVDQSSMSNSSSAADASPAADALPAADASHAADALPAADASHAADALSAADASHAADASAVFMRRVRFDSPSSNGTGRIDTSLRDVTSIDRLVPMRTSSPTLRAASSNVDRAMDTFIFGAPKFDHLSNPASKIKPSPMRKLMFKFHLNINCFNCEGWQTT